MTDLSFSTALNIAKTAKENFILEQYKKLNEFEQYTAQYSYEDYLLRKNNLIRQMFGIEISLGCLDDLIIAEYALTSLDIHNINIDGNTKKVLMPLKGSMYRSNASDFSPSVMGFEWRFAPQTGLWSHLIGDNCISSELHYMFGDEWITNYDVYTLNQIIRKIHTLIGRKEFCNYYAGNRSQLYTYKMAPEVVECYISNCRATERDISDIETYRGIINGTETC